jgi:hypothetical protein
MMDRAQVSMLGFFIGVTDFVRLWMSKELSGYPHNRRSQVQKLGETKSRELRLGCVWWIWQVVGAFTFLTRIGIIKTSLLVNNPRD